MKKYLRFMLTMLVVLTLLLTSCSSKKDDNEELVNNEKTEVMTDKTDDSTKAEELENGIDTITNDETDDSANSETEKELFDEETAEGSEEIIDDDTALEAGEIDITLVDRLLLESIKYKMPDSYKAFANEISMDGELSEVTTYQKGLSIRTETVSESGTSVHIYNAEDGITYMYDIGETTGYIYEDDEDDKLDREEALDQEGMSFFEILQKDMGDIEVKAEMDRFLGRRVVYIEITPLKTVDSDEDENDGIWKMWIDAEYFIPLKYEMMFSDEWFFSSEVVEIEYNLNLSDKLFEKPEGITFN